MIYTRGCAIFALVELILCTVASLAQQCPDRTSIEGTVLDPTGAAISGATVHMIGRAGTNTNDDGYYLLRCLPGTTVRLAADAAGFQEAFANVDIKPGERVHFDFHLLVARVETNVNVGGNDATTLNADHGIGTHTLSGKDIQELADDPDDFRRELQVLAATNGGTPGQARITVDGFQNSSALPPKSSIARIVTAPDMFSAEYDTPPYEGGRIEIYTKPGADSIHGAIFLTDSEASFNATDPFSLVVTPASKRRYGFELTGPIVPAQSNYSLALEKRDIDEFNVVNAITLDAGGNETALHQTVAAPQRLWIASARADLQASKSDILTISFSGNTNNLTNQGVGGLVIGNAGYDSTVSEYDLRIANTQTINATLLHETHLGWTWKDTEETPLSISPSVQVAGYFQSGGSTAQQLNDRERNIEVDDDILYSHGKQTWKLGAQSLGIVVHDTDPNTFNGAYTFSGGIAPVLGAANEPTGQTTTISGLEQYRRAIFNLPGGTPTVFQNTTGTALVPFTQWQLASYVEDTLQLSPRLTLSGGLRYAFQTSPRSYANFAPRAGLAWAIDKRAKTVIHLHAGLFSSVVPEEVTIESSRLNGTRQIESLIYSPSYIAPLTLNSQSIDVTTERALPPSLPQVASFQTGAGIEHVFQHLWKAQANLYYAEAWNDVRSRNINAPLVTSSSDSQADLAASLAAPRPFAANENIFQYEAAGHLSGEVLFLGLDQHSYRRFGFFVGDLFFNFRNDTPSNEGFAQSAYSKQGEVARPDWQSRNRLFFFGNVSLLEQISLSAEMDAQSGQPYNITTGTDNNGDGDFNDRPAYASSAGTDVYATRFGLLSTNTINGDVPRNLGTMSALVHLDANLSREWKIGSKKSASTNTFTLNIRSSNLLNHTNVTAVSSVVSSPTFSQPLVAESARRLELGARFSF